MIAAPSLAALPHIRHGFFTREGGVSEELFASLNCGYGSGDDVARVRENRRRVAEHFGLHEPQLLNCYQIHSAECVLVTEPWVEGPRADAMVTTKPGMALGILTADCVPVLLADRTKNIIGAAHAGWKGALGGVLDNVIAMMRVQGAGDIVATVGPAITQASYEVGAEFRERFVTASLGNARFFSQGDSCLFNLKAYVMQRLADAGVACVECLAHDTYAEEKKFFSFRRATHRNEQVYGRQISVISLSG